MTVAAPRIDVRSIGRVRVITLDRATKRNALDEAAVQALERAWRDFASSDDRVAVLRANGPVFTAGLDMKAAPETTIRPLPSSCSDAMTIRRSSLSAKVYFGVAAPPRPSLSTSTE